MNKSLQKRMYLFKLIYLMILKHFSNVSYVSSQVFCNGDGQVSSSGERCHELCWGFERIGPGTICTTDWSFLGEFLPSWSEDTDPPLFLEVDWCSAMMRLCVSNSLSHALNLLLQLQLLGWCLPHKELIQQLLVLLCQQFCEGGIQHWLEGGLADEDGRETAKEVHTAGDEETNVEDGREEERTTDIGGTEVTHGGTARETRRRSGDEG